ncbi:hypothetical protein X907_1846 [Glycocaulis alkaliphilus]|uniref:Uncharacterized protein n=1 Tax=Glycocaulis alkaliphilus TaxID=1434191 RepID=A0A3T0EAA5_9PROT|nr:DUF2793 domain-containing protein [Glycocaulis alkaliphilus]AZU04373.1 hypothetical protein X907_1846 [Glycocaulis alkaliphilus]GGB77890.1 hypothetical protein GCM10007417_17240 [Glycocaulis alkaliphilus]
MNATSNLNLPFIMPAQAQKHVTHNDALLMLDALVQLSVASRQLSAPPEEPEAGERHIVADAASGPWTGVPEGHLAAFQDGAWRFFAPQTGWTAWIADEGGALVFDGEAWSAFAGAGLNPAAMAGVNTEADETNRLAVKSDAVLFSHDDVTPGNGGIQLKLNKAAPGGTASLLYQTGWSGRAEFGTTGDDDFHIKVSANGADWRDALVIDAASGAVSCPHTPPVANSFNLLKDAGRFGGSPEPQSALVSSFEAPAYLQPVNGAVFVGGPKYIYNNSTYGGPGGALDPDIDALVTRLKDPAFRRYGVEFFVLQVTAGSGTSTVRTVNGTTHYLPLQTPQLPQPPELTINMHVLVKSGSLACTDVSSANRLFLDGVPQATTQRLTPDDGWRQVTRQLVSNPRQHPGYDNIAMRVFATPGTVVWIAALTVTPGLLPMAPERYYGIIPGLEAWR